MAADIAKGLSKLPIEVLHSIYACAQNPHLSQVCKHLRTVLPDFTSYTIQQAEKAFGLDVQVQEDIIQDFLEHYPIWERSIFPSDEASESILKYRVTDDQKNLQGMVCQSWMTTTMLRKLRRRLVLQSVERFYRMIGAQMSSYDQRSFHRFLNEVQGERFSPTMADYNTRTRAKVGLTWVDRPNSKKYSFMVVISSHLFQVYIGERPCVGLILQPFMPAQGLFTFLVEGVADFDGRSQALAQELFAVRVDVEREPRKSDSPWQGHGFNKRGEMVSTGCQTHFDEYIRKMLDSSPRFGMSIPMDLAERCLETVIRFSAPSQVLQHQQTLPTPQRNRAHLKNRPVYIDHKLYHHAIATRNVKGFRMLLKFNSALYNPSIHELKEMMWRTIQGYQHGSIFPPCPAPNRLHIETNSLVEQAKASGKPEYLEMMLIIHAKAHEIGHRILETPEQHTDVVPTRQENQIFTIWEDQGRKRRRSPSD